jgi:anti-sigma regulatory factor (Ser/Thr protein kinase)
MSNRGGVACGPVCLRVRDELEIHDVRRAARRLATELGFGIEARAEVVLIVSELGSNIVKYGISGDITIEPVNSVQFGIGISVIARDIGPPFANLELALIDGYSDRGPIDPIDLPRRKGFGGGLGGIVRLSDVFEYRPGPGEKRVCVIRYLRRPKSGSASTAPR